MQSVYIVCENKISEYLPKPMGKLDFNEPIMSSSVQDSSPFGHFPSQQKPRLNPIKPRFDPIMPDFGGKFSEKTSFNIICLCKDLETATHYLNMNSNRFMLGPYSIL